jgi:hypothetical protein
MWDGIKSATGAAVDWLYAKIKPVIDLFDRVKSKALSLPGLSTAINTTASAVLGPINPFKLKGFATGGIVPGASGSPQVILAHGGERVIPQGKETEEKKNVWQFNFYGDINDQNALIASIMGAIDRRAERESAKGAW